MGWHAKRHVSSSTKKSRTINPLISSIHTSHTYMLGRFTSSLTSKLSFAEKVDPTLRVLRNKLKKFNNPKSIKQNHPVSAAQICKYDLRAGRTTSYYDAEAEALAADLEYVIQTENRRLLENELDKARRLAARRTCRSFAPLMALPEEQRNAVLLALGLGPGILEDAEYRPVELPTRPAGRWKVVVHEPKRGDDDWEPDREVAGILEEEISRSMEDSGNRLRAAEMGQKGQKLLITYGSSGGGD